MATKLVAFDGRGQGDFLFSHDGDVISVVDGRESLVASAAMRLRSCVAIWVSGFRCCWRADPSGLCLGICRAMPRARSGLPELEAKLKDLAQLTSV